MRILIVGATRNPLDSSLWKKRKLAYLKERAFPGTEIELVSPDKGPASIQTDEDVAQAIPNILKKVKEAEDKGFDAIIVSCGMDPAVDECRKHVKIPVIGTGAPAHLMAALLGSKYTIIVPGEKGKRPPDHRIVRKLGFERKLASIRGVGLPILDIREEFIKQDFKITKNLFIEEARKAIEEDGADVIVPGCGYFASFARDAQDKIGVPVIDSVSVALKTAEILVHLGLKHDNDSAKP